MDRLRVEDLAQRADVSVDTIRFYQKRRLLPAPTREGRVAWYGPEHIERLARIRELQAQGLTLALIGRVVERRPRRDRCAARDRGGRRRRARGVPRRSPSWPSAPASPRRCSKQSRGRVCSCPRAHDGEARYTASDVAIVRAGLSLLETGFPFPDLLALAREHNESTREIAEQAVALFDRYVRTPLRDSEQSDRDKADQLVAAFRVLLPAVTALVEHHFRRVLLEVAQEHLDSVGEEHELAAATAEAGRRIEPGSVVMTDTRRIAAAADCRQGDAWSRTCSTASRRATTCSTGC